MSPESSQAASQNTKLGKITIVCDGRISRQKFLTLSRIMNGVRSFATVKMLNADLSEDELLQEMEASPVQLVLIPWDHYLSWSRAEAFFGLSRTTGPTIAGYHFGQIPQSELHSPEHLRRILLDFSGPSTGDAPRIIRALLAENLRSGLKPLLGNGATTIYYEDWTDQHGLGHRIDAVLGLSEINLTHWSERAGSIRIALGALWSLIYEEGPGKSQFAQSINAKRPKAYFQVAASSSFLGLRLFYSMPMWCPKDALAFFWPNPEKPSSPSQLLLRYADFLRVHRIANTTDIEIVVGFFRDAPSDRHPDQLHTFWVEPIDSRLVFEPPFEKESPTTKHLKPLETPNGPINSTARDRVLVDYSAQMNELAQLVRAKDDLIEELKTGGLGTMKPIAPMDTDSLLDAFLDRFHYSQAQVTDLRDRVERMKSEKMNASAAYQQLIKLMRSQESWARRLNNALYSYSEWKSKIKKAA